jgi:hypothetical protein
MASVESIRAGIAPSPHAIVGENVIRAIASYAGQPVHLAREGRPAKGHPFTETLRTTVAPPGYLPLRSTLFSLVDVPDLRALPELWPEAKTVWMGAGPVPEILHRALIALAWLVRLDLLRALTPLAPLMYLATNRLGWGEHRGGMFVAVEGGDAAGALVKRSWHMVAEGDDGPLIPSMAVEALQSITNEKTLVLLLMLAVLLVLGTFMDLAPMIIICTPIFLPVARAYEVAPLHFGVILVLAAGIGLITPPVGSVLFVGAAIGRIEVSQALRSIWPFYGAAGVVLLLVALLPQLSLWLPAVLK